MTGPILLSLLVLLLIVIGGGIYIIVLLDERDALREDRDWWRGIAQASPDFAERMWRGIPE